jgi:DNA-directed RNA polymerase specialized sigma24 family protein
MDSLSQPKLNDAVWLLAANRDDQTGWAVLYRLLRPYVLATCGRLLARSRPLAEDACQEVFIRLIRFAPFQKIAEFGNVYPYVRMVCRSACSDITKKHKDLDVYDDNLGPGIEQHGTWDARLTLKELASKLSDVDANLLEMLLLGLTVGEIAMRSSVTYTAAGVRIHRLKERLSSLAKENREAT